MHLTVRENSSESSNCKTLRLPSHPRHPNELLACVFAAVESFAGGREQHDDMAAALFHFCG